MIPACDPWWVIGSAAAMLHGAATEVADVDVLLSVGDADMLDNELSLGLQPGSGDPVFRSARYGRWMEPPVPVEFMAALRVRGGDMLAPRTRVPMALFDGTIIYVPDRAELIAIFELFGRDKDWARAELLRAPGR